MYFRYQIRTAVSWRIVSELIARHHTKNLQVYETHPGGGQYDCLSIVCDKGRSFTHLSDFNIQSQHLQIFEPYSQPRAELRELRWPDENDYVIQYLKQEDPDEVIGQIEDILGLPRKISNKLTSYVMTLRIISSLLERFMLSEDILEARSGFIDSSGYGSGIREDLYENPEIAAELSKYKDCSKELMKAAQRYWLLTRINTEGETCKRLILDSKGTPYFFMPREPFDLWSFYREPEFRDSAVTMMYEELGGMDKVRKCPNCGAYEVVPIIIGYPTPEAQKKFEEGKVIIGGCIGDAENPGWYCRNCEHGWR